MRLIATLALAFALPALLAGAGCDLDRNEGVLMAAGSYGDLAVLVSSDALRPAVQPFLDALDRPVTFVIKQELPYAIDVYGPGKWELGRGYKNVLFLIDWSDRGKVKDAAEDLLSEETRATLATGGIARVDDPYARYQLGIIVGAPDRNSLASLLRRSEDRIAAMLRETITTRIQDRFRREGLRKELAASYRQHFGFTLEIPVAYAQNQVTPDGYPAVELMRTGPSRGITIGWRPSDDPQALLADREALAAWREELGRKVHDEELVPETFAWTDTTLGGRPALRLAGAWAGEDFAGGGPFWTYFVPDPEGGRVFLVDLLTYAPGEDKMPLFREMRAIAETFRAGGTAPGGA